jgi:hypothetical protein
MPWLLSFTGGSGTSGAISHPAVLSGATSFDVEIDFVPRVVSTGYTPVFSNNDGGASTRHAMYLWGGSRAEIAFIIGGTRRTINSPAGTFASGTRYKVNVVYNGSTLQMLVNGTSVASTTATGTVGGASGLNTIGANLTETRPQIDLYGYKITENGSLVRNYDPSASGGSGTILPEIVSSQNGTQFGTWPANNDEWVFYSSGATYQLTALGGTFSYSGAQASLLRRFRLQTLGATYAYSGASANLTYVPTGTVYTLTALGGSFAYSGAQASLLRRFRLIANGGAYSYAGGSANLTYNQLPGVYRLTALGATYTYTGGIATLTATGVTPTANPGAYMIQAYVGGVQAISAKIGGRQTINATVAI